MTKFEEIIQASEIVNKFWGSANIPDNFSTNFTIPKLNPRSLIIDSYNLSLLNINDFIFSENDLIIFDNNLDIKYFEKIKGKLVAVDAKEYGIKTRSEINKLLENLKTSKRVVAIGGGLIINISAYIAEKFKSDFILFPTTPLAMSDASIGGKVRVNDITSDGVHIKHAYKSFYEPNDIFIDKNFLETLSNEQIKISLAEIIKHGVYQSNDLLDFLLSKDFNPYLNKESLLKAILWTADLKRICLEIDPHDNTSVNGSNLILRAAHDISDKIEEGMCFKIDHGEAVLRAMLVDPNNKKMDLMIKLYKKLDIVLDTLEKGQNDMLKYNQ